MNGVKANSGIRMENTRRRDPAMASQFAHPRPGQSVLLTATHRSMPAARAGSPDSEIRQAVSVARYRVVVEVALHDRSEPFAGLPPPVRACG